ncbi:S8 family serine peptidase [Chitinophaga sp. MD30]|uniref:S8 family serine peptidase n=1 Tax=Chitinophaga sp. MD30 TaxID=2033437 RepID=UPI0012FD9098|nr:S8 family serine peptidase [Chitinophaga sp. MD30]
MSRQPVVAIIDEGLLMDRFAAQTTPVQEINIYESTNTNVDNIADMATKRLHGTNIASIRLQVCPSASILSVRMVPLKTINVPLLCKALRFCAELPVVNVINISLGILSTDTYSQELFECCRYCHQKGKILVAAAHFNCEKKCYPAAFPFVYGVGAGLISDINQYSYLGDGYINILAKGIHQRLLHENDKYILRGGTSYATAAFSGILCNKLINETADNTINIHDHIRQGGTNTLNLHYLIEYQPEETTTHIPVTGINKAWKCLSYALDHTPVKDPAVLADQLLFNMNYFLQGNTPEIQYPGIPDLKPLVSGKMFNRVNTLLIGNFFDNKHLLNVYFGYTLIRQFIEHNGNFLVFDEYIANVIRKTVLLFGSRFNGQIVILETLSI